MKIRMGEKNKHERDSLPPKSRLSRRRDTENLDRSPGKTNGGRCRKDGAGAGVLMSGYGPVLYRPLRWYELVFIGKLEGVTEGAVMPLAALSVWKRLQSLGKRVI